MSEPKKPTPERAQLDVLRDRMRGLLARSFTMSRGRTGDEREGRDAAEGRAIVALLADGEKLFDDVEAFLRTQVKPPDANGGKK